jgi:hypothetical protein
MTQKADQEVLSTAQRWLEILVVVALLLLFGFFAYHQVTNTGFFTAQFGSLEMLCLYGPIVLATAAPLVRVSTGRRNPARPLEAASSLLTAMTAVWFLITFPFNFAHFADALPGAVRFVLAWITDDIAKIPLVLQIILSPISALVTIWHYLSLRWREPATMSHQRIS